jgi:hypothetical protein
MKKVIALILALGLIAPACATSQRSRFVVKSGDLPSDAVTSESTQSARERELLAEFARQLPPGTRVRASVGGRRVIRGTLLKTTDTAIAIQPRGRVPEPVVEVPFTNLMALEQEQPSGGGSTGRAVAIGAAAGAGAAIGVLLILIAVLSD